MSSRTNIRAKFWKNKKWIDGIWKLMKIYIHALKCQKYRTPLAALADIYCMNDHEMFFNSLINILLEFKFFWKCNRCKIIFIRKRKVQILRKLFIFFELSFTKHEITHLIRNGNLFLFISEVIPKKVCGIRDSGTIWKLVQLDLKYTLFFDVSEVMPYDVDTN